MNVMIIENGTKMSVNASYGARLVEQGTAVPVKDKKPVKLRKTEVTEDVTEEQDT